MHELPPIVFIGPTAPRQDVLSALPDALVAPPCRRGDLYRYRILKHSIFLIIDGVFGGSLAVPPREVIDVIKDGAVVIGASSMGALRAADCFPAGAVGIGIVYRLYRRRAISSEDEVAVTFREDRPYPSLTEPLINIRVALRRAVNLGLMTAADGVSIVAAAEINALLSSHMERGVQGRWDHTSHGDARVSQGGRRKAAGREPGVSTGSRNGCGWGLCDHSRQSTGLDCSDCWRKGASVSLTRSTAPKLMQSELISWRGSWSPDTFTGCICPDFQHERDHQQADRRAGKYALGRDQHFVRLRRRSYQGSMCSIER